RREPPAAHRGNSPTTPATPRPHAPRRAAVWAPRHGRVSLVSTQPGREERPRFVFNGHLDHFPSDDPSLWSFPPYGGEIRDGKILGRGVSDMRGGLTASLFSFLLIQEHRVPLRGPLTLMMVADEETGGPWGPAFILEHPPQFPPDA